MGPIFSSADFIRDMIWMDNESLIMSVLVHNQKIQFVSFKAIDATEIFRFEL